MQSTRDRAHLGLPPKILYSHQRKSASKTHSERLVRPSQSIFLHGQTALKVDKSNRQECVYQALVQRIEGVY